LGIAKTTPSSQRIGTRRKMSEANDLLCGLCEPQRTLRFNQPNENAKDAMVRNGRKGPLREEICSKTILSRPALFIIHC
jgi:hypothetical protein